MNIEVTQGLSIIKQNGLCSIQDLGRMSSQHLGFSASGAADEYAFLFANHLLNNNRNDAALEVTLGQITFKAEQNCTIAITGADCSVRINEKPIKNWQAHQIKSGDIIHFTLPKSGLHTYMAIAGGIQSKQWLNSQAQTSTETSLGFTAPVLSAKSVIPISNHSMTPIEAINIKPSHFYSALNEPLTLRFIPQALYKGFSNKRQTAFCEHIFTVSPNINRMGYRLSAMPEYITANMRTENTLPKLSKPVTYGTIQLPSNNQPIVLMKERQTIGGYPTLGCVIQTDLFKLSQLRPGNKVKFIPTSLTFAQQQLNAMYQRFK